MQKGQTLIFLLVGILVLAIAGGAFYLGKQATSKPSPAPVVVSQTPQPTIDSQPTISPSSSPDITVNWKAYKGQYTTFKYPATWNPKSQILRPGVILESVNLGIPNVVSDQDLGFSGVGLEALKPNDVAREETVSIGGKNGFKWIRKGENYVSYDYYTKGDQDKGSFGVHVTVASEDKDLESKLDQLVNSIEFITK